MTSRPATFDAYRLARDKGMREGTLDIAASDRLADRVAEGEGSVEWRIEGTVDGVGRPALAVTIKGTVPLTCQRCLGEMAYPVEQTTVAVLARSESDADAVDSSSGDEVLVADHPLDPVELVEDELLLTLPYAPMHESADCATEEAK